MAEILSELAAWIADNVSGITIFDGSTQVGNLHITSLPDSDTGLEEALTLAYDGGVEPGGVRGKYKQRLVFVGRMAASETKVRACYDWIATRGGTQTYPTGCSLTTFEVQRFRMFGEPVFAVDPETGADWWSFNFEITYYRQ